MRFRRGTRWETGQILAITLAVLVISSTVTPIIGVAAAQQTQSDAINAASEQPNLVVTDVEWRPTQPNAGEDMEFQLTIKNTGTAMAENVEASVRVDGELAAVPPLRDIGSGETSTTAWTGSYTVSGGAHTVEGIVDPDDHIAESDETDNSITDQFTAETSYGSVDGYVTDDSGDPIDGARVYLGSRTSTRTNSNGYYEFTDVPPGGYSVEVVMSGYESESEPVDVYESGTAEADFSLTPETFTVELSSEPISVYTDGDGTYDFGEDVPISAPASEDGYEFQAWETRDGEVVSRDSTFTIDYLNTDLTLVAQYAKPGKPDLTIDDISWDVTDPEEGEDVTFYVEISNDGEARAANLNLELSVGNDIFRTGNLDLEPGEEKTVQIGPWSADEGTEEVRSEIDYADEIDEEDETNNERDESFVVSNQQADLRVTDITLSPSPPTVGEDVSVSVTVTNAGDAPAENVDTKVSVQGEILSESNIDFAAGETRRLSMGSFRLEETSGDSIDATATTDYTDEIDEEDETNNRITDAIPIDKGHPNLEVATINIDPRYPEAGDEVAFQVVVANTGEISADYVEVAVDLGSQTVRLDEIRSIEGGETVSSEYTFGREFEGGTHTIEAFVDPDDDIDESSETDNTGQKTFSIDPETGTIEGRVLTVTGEAVEDAEVVVGGRTTVTDDDGYFRLTGLESGPAVLVVEKDGFPRYERDIQVPTGTTAEYSVELESREFEVTLDSEPINVGLRGEGHYNRGDEVTLVAPDVGEEYTFEGWREGDTIVSEEPTFVIDDLGEDRDLTAVYTKAAETELRIDRIEVMPEQLRAGESADILLVLGNQGEAAAEDITLSIRAGNTVFERTVEALPANEEVKIEIEEWVPRESAEQVVVSATGENAETAEPVQFSKEFDIDVEEPTPTPTETPTETSTPEPGESVTAVVNSEDGDPVQGVTVSLTELDEQAITDSSGVAEFSGLDAGSYIVKISGEPLGSTTKTAIVTVESDEGGSVTFTVDTSDPQATLSGSVYWEDGSPVQSGEVLIKTGPDRTIGTATISNAQFEFGQTLSPDKYLIVVRQDGEKITQRNLMLSDGSNRVTVSAQPLGENKERLTAAIMGLTFGDWCWKNDGPAPSWCGDSVRDYQIEFLSGWIASGFVVVGDLRDLPNTVLDRNPVDFALTVIALIPVVGDGASVLSKIGKFLRKSPRLLDEVLTLIKNSRFFDGIRGATKTKAYKATLEGNGVKNPGRLADAGVDMERAANFIKAHPDEGAKLLNKLGPEETKQALRVVDDLDSQSTKRAIELLNGVSLSRTKSVLKMMDDVDPAVKRKLVNLNVKHASGATENLGRFYDAGKLSKTRTESIVRSLDQFENTNGISRVTEKMSDAENFGGFKGPAYEPEAASKLADRGFDIEEFRQPVTKSKHGVKGDVDVVGRVDGKRVGVEVKSGRLSSIEKGKFLDGEIRPIQKAIENGNLDQGAVYTKREPPEWLVGQADGYNFKMYGPWKQAGDLAPPPVSVQTNVAELHVPAV